MQTTVFSVPDISCEHCKKAIESALRKLDGVARAEVNVAQKKVTVSYQEARIGREALAAAIRGEGYTVES